MEGPIRKPIFVKNVKIERSRRAAGRDEKEACINAHGLLSKKRRRVHVIGITKKGGDQVGAHNSEAKVPKT